jgi:hypothetical protein
MKAAVLWNAAPCSLLDTDRRFRRAYCLHRQGDLSLKSEHGEPSHSRARFFVTHLMLSSRLLPLIPSHPTWLDRRNNTWLCSSPNIIRQIKSRRMKLVGHVARMGEDSKVYKVLVGKPEGKRSLRRPRSRWQDWMRMDLREIGWGVWCGSSSLRIGALVNTVVNLRVLAPRS